MDEYEEAVRLISQKNLKFLVKIPASRGLIEDLERSLQVSLPVSYKRMLSEFGVLLFSGRMFYGIGRDGVEGTAAPNVVFVTKNRRENDEITNQMVEIMPSGYGPYFVIDCAEMDERGEAPIYEVSEFGHLHGKRKVAENFGALLLAEVKDVIANA